MIVFEYCRHNTQKKNETNLFNWHTLIDGTFTWNNQGGISSILCNCTGRVVVVILIGLHPWVLVVSSGYNL